MLRSRVFVPSNEVFTRQLRRVVVAQPLLWWGGGGRSFARVVDQAPSRFSFHNTTPGRLVALDWLIILFRALAVPRLRLAVVFPAVVTPWDDFYLGTGFAARRSNRAIIPARSARRHTAVRYRRSYPSPVLMPVGRFFLNLLALRFYLPAAGVVIFLSSLH